MNIPRSFRGFLRRFHRNSYQTALHHNNLNNDEDSISGAEKERQDPKRERFQQRRTKGG